MYKYPLEYVIEGLAPTVERDFDMLPKEKQEIYRAIQASHIHGSPDGPWFFIIARNDVQNDAYQLLGITDTAMLRPQVFALQDGEVQIGLICSEKQAIDATLRSLASEDDRFCPFADDYWNARGGSYTDGGAFIFTVKKNGNGGFSLSCTDKFGRPRTVKQGVRPNCKLQVSDYKPFEGLPELLSEKSGKTLYEVGKDAAQEVGIEALKRLCAGILSRTLTDDEREAAINALTLLIDRRYPTGNNKRSTILDLLHKTLAGVLGGVPSIAESPTSRYVKIGWESRSALRAPDGRGSSYRKCDRFSTRRRGM